MEVIKDPKGFVSLGYEVRPSVNGGFVVLIGEVYKESSFRREFAAFTCASDMHAWLKKGHADYDAGEGK